MTEYATEGITTEAVEIMVGIETEGVPEGLAEKVHLHAHDAAARALQAIENEQPPEDCPGIGITIDWDGVIAGKYEKVPPR